MPSEPAIPVEAHVGRWCEACAHRWVQSDESTCPRCGAPSLEVISAPVEGGHVLFHLASFIRAESEGGVQDLGATTERVLWTSPRFVVSPGHLDGSTHVRILRESTDYGEAVLFIQITRPEVGESPGVDDGSQQQVDEAGEESDTGKVALNDHIICQLNPAFGCPDRFGRCASVGTCLHLERP